MSAPAYRLGARWGLGGVSEAREMRANEIRTELRRGRFYVTPGGLKHWPALDAFNAIVAERDELEKRLTNAGNAQAADHYFLGAATRRAEAAEERSRLLAEALSQARAAHLGDQRIANELVNHFPVELRCDHEAQQDMVICDCALVNLGWHPSIRLAKEAWAQHVIEAVRGARLASVAPGDADAVAQAVDRTLEGERS